MSRPTAFGRDRAVLGGALGGTPGQGDGQPPPVDCCDPDSDAFPDRGSDGNVVGRSTGGTATLLQSAFDVDSLGTLTATLAAPPTPGNLLIALFTGRSKTAAGIGAGAVPSGFTGLTAFESDIFNGGASQLSYRFVQTGDSASVSASGGGSRSRLVVAEFAGVGAFDQEDELNDQASSTALSIGPVSLSEDSLVIAAFVTPVTGATFTPGTGYDEIDEGDVGSFGPSHHLIYKVETGATATASSTASSAGEYGAKIATFDGFSTAAWVIPLPSVNDGSDATYDTVTGTELVRIDLGAAHRIVRTRIRIAANTSGARTLTIKGANLPDFSDEVTLATIPFTATGSYTAQDVTATWANSTAYRYYELSIGTSDTYRIHAWELYEGNLATDLADHTGSASDAHDAAAIDYDNGSSGLTADDVQEAIDELAAAASGGLGWFMVTDYGAVGDGTTDDTASIQAAIDACFAAGGGTIFFPPGIYQLDGALQDTGTYNSQLEIPHNDFDPGVGALSIRFLGSGPSTPITDSHDAGAILRSSWDGSISGNPAIISAGTHDLDIGDDFNWVFVSFEQIEIRAHTNPKLTAIDMTAAVSLHWSQLTVGVEYGASPSFDDPTNANAIGIDMPWGALSQPGDGGTGLYIDGYYIGIRPSEQMVADIISVSRCAQGAQFRGQHDSPAHLRHATNVGRIEVFYCIRGLVFTGDDRWVSIALACFEHDDSPFETVYDIDDGSNLAHGFIGWHTADYTTGVEDNLLVNGGQKLSLHGISVERWRLANVVHIPTGTDPSANPANGRYLYADSSTGVLTVKKPDGSTVDLEAGADVDAEDVDYDNATSGLTATDVQAAIDELVAGASAAGLIPVDTGSVAYDTSTPGEIGITVTSDWGVDSGVAYYDDGGASAGEEAALFWDPATSQYAVIPFEF